MACARAFTLAERFLPIQDFYMDDVDRWIYFDGPEPERIRPLLDALRDLPPATPEDKERVARRFFEKLDAMLLLREEQSRRN